MNSSTSYYLEFVSQFYNADGNTNMIARTFYASLRYEAILNGNSAIEITIPKQAFLESPQWGSPIDNSNLYYKPQKNDIVRLYCGNDDNLIVCGIFFIEKRPEFSTDNQLYILRCSSLERKGDRQSARGARRTNSLEVSSSKNLLETFIQGQFQFLTNILTQINYDKLTQDRLSNGKVSVNYNLNDDFANVRSFIMLQQGIHIFTTYDIEGVNNIIKFYISNTLYENSNKEPDCIIDLNQNEYISISEQESNYAWDTKPIVRQCYYQFKLKKDRVMITSKLFFNLAGEDGTIDFRNPPVRLEDLFSTQRWREIHDALIQATSINEISTEIADIKNALNSVMLNRIAFDALQSLDFVIKLATNLLVDRQYLAAESNNSPYQNPFWSVGKRIMVTFREYNIKQEMIIKTVRMFSSPEQNYIELVVGKSDAYDLTDNTKWTLDEEVKNAIQTVNIANGTALSVDTAITALGTDEEITTQINFTRQVANLVIEGIRKNPNKYPFQIGLLSGFNYGSFLDDSINKK